MWSPAPLPRTLAAAVRDLDDARPAVRVSALADLARHASESPHAVAEAAKTRLTDRSSDVRAHAAAVLGETGRLVDVPELTRAIEDDDPVVRQMAIEALGEIGGDDAERTIDRGLSDARPDVRFQSLLAAVRRPGHDGVERALLSAFGDDDEAIRHIALRSAEERWLLAAFPPEIVAGARALIGDPSPEVRVAAAILLAEAGDRAGSDVLLAVVEDRLASREAEDVRAAIEHAGAVVGDRARRGLEQRAFGPGRYFREQHSWSAIVALAALGNDKACREIESALGSLMRGKRELGVAAVGRARLAAHRARVVGLRDDDKVDAAVADEALSRLDRLDCAAMTDANEWNAVRFSPEKSAGHVESYFLKLNSPDGERALWLKATILARPLAKPVAEAWAISFRRDGRHLAAKQVVPFDAASFDKRALAVEVAGLSLFPGTTRGEVARGEERIKWDLTFRDDSPPLVPFPLPSMYTGSFPKSKLVSPYPDATFDGWFDVMGERVDVRGWRGMQGHNWGVCHTHHYAWVHCNQFDGDDAVFEGMTGRVKMGPIVAPPLTVLCLRHRGTQYFWNRVRDLATSHGTIGRRTWSFAAESDLGSLEGDVSSPDDLVVGLLYENPEGAPTYCLNSKLSTAKLTLTPKGRPPIQLRSQTAALEIGTKDASHGVRVRA